MIDAERGIRTPVEEFLLFVGQDVDIIWVVRWIRQIIDVEEFREASLGSEHPCTPLVVPNPKYPCIISILATWQLTGGVNPRYVSRTRDGMSPIPVTVNKPVGNEFRLL
jgi:hypothetical protein